MGSLAADGGPHAPGRRPDPRRATPPAGAAGPGVRAPARRPAPPARAHRVPAAGGRRRPLGRGRPARPVLLPGVGLPGLRRGGPAVGGRAEPGRAAQRAGPGVPRRRRRSGGASVGRRRRRRVRPADRSGLGERGRPVALLVARRLRDARAAARARHPPQRLPAQGGRPPHLRAAPAAGGAGQVGLRRDPGGRVRRGRAGCGPPGAVRHDPAGPRPRRPVRRLRRPAPGADAGHRQPGVLAGHVTPGIWSR